MSEVPEGEVIQIVAAVIRDAIGRTLLVRKRGSAMFQQPGGKVDAADADALATLARELHEELGCRMRREGARYLGTFEAMAANEPGQRVRAQVYQVTVEGECRAQAEIEALCWIEPAHPGDLPIAVLSREQILPLLR